MQGKEHVATAPQPVYRGEPQAPSQTSMPLSGVWSRIWLFPLQMIQSLKAVIENADAVYEKIVYCQKAGKWKFVSSL